MTSYTFLWANDTWERKKQAGQGDDLIDYIAGDNKRPLSQLVEDDEVFVITVKRGDVYVGGRLIVGSKPMSRAEAAARLRRDHLIEKEIYVLAKPDRLDRFRPARLVDLQDAKELELYSSDGRGKRPDLDSNGRIDRQTFRAPYRLSELSANVLRGYLELGSTSENPRHVPAKPTGPTPARREESPLPADIQLANDIEDLGSTLALIGKSISETEIDAWVKQRLGQGSFRATLFPIFGHRCPLSGIKNERLLIASHIRPWCRSDNQARRNPENGLLLSVAWEALFDKGMISFSEEGGVIVSELLNEDDARALGISFNVRLHRRFLTPARREFLRFHRDHCFRRFQSQQ